MPEPLLCGVDDGFLVEAAGLAFDVHELLDI